MIGVEFVAKGDNKISTDNTLENTGERIGEGYGAIVTGVGGDTFFKDRNDSGVFPRIRDLRGFKRTSINNREGEGKRCGTVFNNEVIDEMGGETTTRGKFRKCKFNSPGREQFSGGRLRTRVRMRCKNRR